MKKLVWKTVTRTVGQLVPNAANPRTISPKQLEDLKKSLQKFNLVEVPVLDTENNVLAGHQRLEVLKLLGRGDETIDVRVPNRPLTQRERDQYLLTSNRVHGEWDWAKLAGFDLELLAASGFDDADIAHVFDDLETEDDGFDADAELRKIKKPKAKPGDLYQLGPHRLLCGDSTDSAVVARVVGSGRVDMVYCDPVYNIDLSYEKGVGGTKHYGGTATDSKTEVEYEAFLRQTIRNALAVSGKDAHVFYYCDQRYVGLLQRLYAELGVRYQRTCLWLKGIANPTPQTAFSKVYEPCVYGSRGKPHLSPSHRNFDEVLNREVGTGAAMIEHVMGMFDVWAVQRLAGNAYEHPTEKPVSLHDKPIKRCTRVGDGILSLFGGSGGELVAAHQLKRVCYMVEKDPVFVDLIIRRFKKMTGQKAEKLTDGHEED